MPQSTLSSRPTSTTCELSCPPDARLGLLDPTGTDTNQLRRLRADIEYRRPTDWTLPRLRCRAAGHGVPQAERNALALFINYQRHCRR